MGAFAAGSRIPKAGTQRNRAGQCRPTEVCTLRGIFKQYIIPLKVASANLLFDHESCLTAQLPRGLLTAANASGCRAHQLRVISSPVARPAGTSRIQ